METQYLVSVIVPYKMIVPAVDAGVLPSFTPDFQVALCRAKNSMEAVFGRTAPAYAAKFNFSQKGIDFQLVDESLFYSTLPESSL